jgi:hypothetical protein
MLTRLANLEQECKGSLRAAYTRSLMAVRSSCLHKCPTISTTSPSQQGVEGTDSEEIWIITEESAV